MKLIPLPVWLEQTFGEHQPTINTARAWCRQGRIKPTPKKIGRTYYLQPNAEHVNNASSNTRLIERILGETA